MARNKVLDDLLSTTRGINYANREPSMSMRTIRSMRLNVVKYGSPVTANGEERREGWYAMCPKCNGTGIWDNDFAIDDEYHSEVGRKTCFDCGQTNNGWFRLPEVEHYQQSCVLWCMWRIYNNKVQDVYRVAKSEIAYVKGIRKEFDENDWLCQMVPFWETVLDKMNRRRDGGRFMEREEVEAQMVLARAVKAWQVILKQQEEMKVRRETGLPKTLVDILKEAWEKTPNNETMPSDTGVNEEVL